MSDKINRLQQQARKALLCLLTLTACFSVVNVGFIVTTSNNGLTYSVYTLSALLNICGFIWGIREWRINKHGFE